LDHRNNFVGTLKVGTLKLLMLQKILIF